MSPTALNTYRVHLHEEAGDKFVLVFDCEADDDDHAAEQAENAYPGCEVLTTTRLRSSAFGPGADTDPED